MNLYSKQINSAFLISLLFTFLTPALFHSLRILFFSPFLVILFYKKKLSVCLWSACLCGVIIDLLSSHSRLGIHAFAYVCTTWILFGFKRHFFADSLSTLPIMTFFFSVLTSTILLLLVYTFEKNIHIHPNWILTDLIFFSALDALYAFCIFILPAWLFGKPIRKGREYFRERSFEKG
ncbi:MULTISPECIES: hypothetical protein [Parachlamydia]|uniref:Rod shape-determining protein MreD n=2 Tax=Parachlamydia acanthamoebae TaxID=83552 RepID=F8L0X1_PARAV|nr:hypothetical protein [Parachlamydia acanthamoebae]KIA77403.1 hypothetical protein DB43_GI00030 [Parachlamydia acanthamoebae]CCB86880.1 putative uncharacterized protein [Parachlamydia acanthamoebae UV-7]